jgi:hypothetical protein
MLPLDQAGAQHSRSPVEAEGGAVMVGTKFPLCPGVDINRISLCENNCPNVCSGSDSDLSASRRRVRFAPINRHRKVRPLSPFSANFGLMHEATVSPI